MRDNILKNLLVNLRALFTTNLRRRDNDAQRRIAALENAMDGVNAELSGYRLRQKTLDYFNSHPVEAKPFVGELSYLQSACETVNFPYPPAKTAGSACVECGRDGDLPYVVHRGRRLFFPARFSTDEALQMYCNYHCIEHLLGATDASQLPHQYQSPRIRVEDGDTILDIGAAEGLFALDNIEQVSRVVLVEGNTDWIAPLRRTFAPYGDKARIVDRMVGPCDTGQQVSLTSLLAECGQGSVFVKMDIEGCEVPTLCAACGDLAATNRHLKFSIATYHRQYDYDDLCQLFSCLGWRHEPSTGYMLFSSYDTPQPPYFRHGIIRATNK